MKTISRISAALLLLVFSAIAAASPVNWIVEEIEPVPGFSADGFARVQFPMPLHAEILGVELINKQLHLHVSIDPEAPMVWRVIQLQAGVTPQTIPTERYIDLIRWDGLVIHAWDMGQFSEPIPSAGGGK